MPTPIKGLDELNSHANRRPLSLCCGPAYVPILCPYVNSYAYARGATLENMSIWARDDIILWAIQYPNYTEHWSTYDVPIGEGLPGLPEAGCNACDTLRRLVTNVAPSSK